MPEYCTPPNWESFYHHFIISMGSFKYALFVCLFFFSVPFYFFPNTHAEEKERDKHNWHKVHETVKAEKQKLNRSLCSLLTASKMLLSLSYVVFIELHKKLNSLKLHLNLQQIRHHLNEMKRNYNCLSIPFRLTGSKTLKNGSELKKSRAVAIIYIYIITEIVRAIWLVKNLWFSIPVNP